MQFPRFNPPTTASYTDVMIDIETQGLEFGRPIIQVGVCFFNLLDESLEGMAVERYSIRSDVQDGLGPCEITQGWWKRTNAELYEQLLIDSKSSAALPIGEAIASIGAALKHKGVTRIWADYPAFDIAHLEIACQRIGAEAPWQHRHVQSSSTVKQMCRVLLGGEVTVPEHLGRLDHEAGSDAYQQALEVKAWVDQLRRAMPMAMMEGVLRSFADTVAKGLRA